MQIRIRCIAFVLFCIIEAAKVRSNRYAKSRSVNRSRDRIFSLSFFFCSSEASHQEGKWTNPNAKYICDAYCQLSNRVWPMYANLGQFEEKFIYFCSKKHERALMSLRN